ncbi:Butirosin biosynthesis, BtrG-like protein [Gorgonomyces haynaldii]|nr:Butirosin biosynthesis, BtrG-like protein [Gorgonomyces haynaldii]
MQPIFVYGSLISPIVYDNVMQGIKRQQERRVPAVLRGYRRVCVRNAPYPALIQEEGQVEGVLVFVENQDQIDALDRFETDMYKRISVQTIVKESWGDRQVEAFVYLWNDAQDKLLDQEWSYEDFEKNKLPQWIQQEFPVK